MAGPVRVYLEEGRSWTFAAAVDWPGWCRRGKGEAAALDLLAGYAERYRPVAGPAFRPGSTQVLGRLAGNATTDFGAPAAFGEWDHLPFAAGELDRLLALLQACWRYLDRVVAGAPAQLRKGPRGGGRDRDAIFGHVREAERAYGPKVGARIAARTTWPEQRDQLAGALRRQPAAGRWPVRYAVRRLAWHVLDHAWEIEDRSG